MPIQSPGDVERFREQVEVFVFATAIDASQMGVTLVAQRMRETTAFGDQTGNLRGSIGHPGPVAASLSTVGFGPIPVDELVRRMGDSVRILLPIGMSYAADVDDRTGFTREAVDEAPDIFDEVFSDAREYVEREVERMAA